MNSASTDCVFDLARTAADTTYEELPAEVIRAAKTLVLDGIAVTFAGSSATGIPELAQLMTDWGGREEARVLGFQPRLPAPSAAMLNASMMHARDFDDNLDKARFHASTCILPAALAVAEATKSSGKEFLAAYVAGVEMACRLADVVPLHRGWHQTSVLGSLGAAVAAGKLLKLEVDGLVNSIGHAYTMAAGNIQGRVDRTLEKRVQVGLSTRNGVTAAYIAKQGITGARRVIEGSHGLLSLYAVPAIADDKSRVRDLLAAPSDQTYITQLSMKPYPCCRGCHGPAYGVSHLMQRHKLEAARVQSIDLLVPEYVSTIVGGPFQPAADPQVEAQFSAAYTSVVMMLRGSLSIADFEPEVVQELDPEFVRSKVREEVDDSLGGRRLSPVVVRLTLKSGEQLKTEVDVLPGHPDNPMDESLHRAKVRDCLSQILGRQAAATHAERLENSVGSLESVSVDEFMEVIAASPVDLVR
ncbi:MAG: MmgE/PrpD family protein [Trueperaceae bacterium]